MLLSVLGFIGKSIHWEKRFVIGKNGCWEKKALGNPDWEKRPPTVFGIKVSDS